jgi:hypothetical protein
MEKIGSTQTHKEQSDLVNLVAKIKDDTETGRQQDKTQGSEIVRGTQKTSGHETNKVLT